MKALLVIFFLALTQQICFGQNLRRWDTQIDSLQNQYENPSSDSVRLKTALELVDLLINKGWTTTNLGQFAIAYATYGKAFELWESQEMKRLFQQKGKNQDAEKRYWSLLSNLNFNYGHLMGVTGNIKEQHFYYQKAYEIASKWEDVSNTVFALSGMAWVHLKNNELDSAKIKLERVTGIPPELYNYENYADLLFVDGTVKLKTERYLEAKRTFLIGTQDASRQSYVVGLAANNLGLSMAYRQLNLPDSSLYFGKISLDILKRIREIQMFDVDIATAYDNLYHHFLHFDQPDSAFLYLGLAYQEREKLTDLKTTNLAAFQQVLLERERRLSVLEKEKIEMQNRFTMYFLLTILAVFFVLGAILLSSYRQKEKANLLLAKQKEAVQTALTQLKSTQAQLIQSEKMASLGELTAGIAHEIQNPLNFVNNFSEVSAELMDELKGERSKEPGERDETVEEEIISDVIQNLEKISHHGKRADAIVKGMLAHSRASSGEKEPTDINALADEYLRLSHQAYLSNRQVRAKDKSLNNLPIAFGVMTDFDPNLPKVNVVPQEIGRLLQNIINNAFQACELKNAEGFKPIVTVSTKNLGDKIQISISDNGPGIPDTIKDKIFQPFFTTKPAGEGTGLGLSLSYDIVKAHGGELIMNSKQGEGTQFIIQLPVKERNI